MSIVTNSNSDSNSSNTTNSRLSEHTDHICVLSNINQCNKKEHSENTKIVHTELMHNTRIVAFAASWATVLTKSILHPLDTIKSRTQVYLSIQNAHSPRLSKHNIANNNTTTNNNNNKSRDRVYTYTRHGNILKRGKWWTSFYYRRALADWRGIVNAYAGKWSLFDLYGGLLIKLVLYVPYQTAYMTGYNVAKNKLHTREAMQAEVELEKEEHNAKQIHEVADKTKSNNKKYETRHNAAYLWRTIVAALAAEFTSCLIRVPMEVIKTRIQTITVANTHDAIKQLHYNGWRSCFRLILPQTLMHDVPYSVIQWTVYESLRMWMMRWHDHRESFLSIKESNESSSVKQVETSSAEPRSFIQRYRTELTRSFWSGGFSGLIASICTVPVDNIRTRMIVKSASQPSLKMSELVVYVYKCNGIRGFYRGGAMRILWVTTNMAFYFPLFECFRMAALAHPEKLGIHVDTGS